MNLLETRIETQYLTFSRLSLNKEINLYSIWRKDKNVEISIGTVKFSFEYLEKSCKFSSFEFNLDISNDESKNGIETSYIFSIIAKCFVPSAFETLDIESVIVGYDLPDEIISVLVEGFHFEKQNNNLILTRSKWGKDNGELISLAMFDILGFENFVSNHRHDATLQLYRKLVALLKDYRGGIGVVPLSNEWKGAAYVAGIYGNIHITYASDTFMIWTDYRDESEFLTWLASGFNEEFPLLYFEPNTSYYPRFYKQHVNYTNFLEISMEFFCQAVISGIPLRGCISTGLATLDTHRSVFVGSPLVEAARGESGQDSIGFAYGKSFNNYHPVWNKYHIPYEKHKKPPSKDTLHLSPMVVDYPRYWREHHPDKDFVQLITQMNVKLNPEQKPNISKYYDNAIEFFQFSNGHENWLAEVDKDNIKSIIDFYDKTNSWLISVT
ncbi:MAG: hypothetical protein FWG94_09910 [Oscillospiraceae bacterium]|nr:hypothetical protein [Oscillospiraceae bacterium]